MSCILTDQLYVGDAALVRYVDKLKEWHIQAIINVAEECTYSQQEIDQLAQEHKIDVYNFPLVDSLDCNLHKYVYDVAQLMNLLIENGCAVYIHCNSGINRSPACVVAYLMIYKKMTLDAAYKFVTDKRPTILTNQRFKQDLQRLPL